jgi:hypothetical protein
MQASTNQRRAAFSVMVLAGLAIFLTGCGPNDFNDGKAANMIEGNTLRLDAEYAMLTGQQYDCGIEEDLWERPLQPMGLPGQIGTARLTQKGRDLKFSDDVSVGDKRYPYVQVNGDFNMKVIDIVADKDGPDQFSRLVETHVGVLIQHTCFLTALPLMGVRKGQFTQDYSPVLFFRYNNGWSIEKVVHN